MVAATTSAATPEPASAVERPDTEVVVVPGDAPHRPDVGPDRPLGQVSPGVAIPGLDLTAFPSAPSPSVSTGLTGANSFSAGWGCSVQCITGGVAHARGFGAQLEVDTSVEAELFVSVIGDAEGDGHWEYSSFEWSDGPVTHFGWSLDDLAPGQTYYVMVSATDAGGGSSIAYGELTTLSHRRAHVSLGDLTIEGGVSHRSLSRYVSVDGGGWADHTPGDEGINLYDGLPGRIDLGVRVVRHYDPERRAFCEALGPGPSSGHGAVDCHAYNTATIDDVDLDVAPAGRDRWTDTEVQVQLHTPTGAGGALPIGYGEEHHFHFSAPVTIWVTYS